jgi:hypothetical protein
VSKIGARTEAGNGTKWLYPGGPELGLLIQMQYSTFISPLEGRSPILMIRALSWMRIRKFDSISLFAAVHFADLP